MKSVDAPIILADSISPEGIRLITWQLRYWRPIHSELMTHRVFSRNAGSSRARPSQAIIEQVRSDPWGPLHWGKNEPGMQANTELEGDDLTSAQKQWEAAALGASIMAGTLLSAGAHKQIVNRLLEPFTYIDVVLSGTDFANWYALRDHKDAQPEIRELASLMKEVQAHSEPKLLQPGEWHLPYVLNEDRTKAIDWISEREGISSALVSERMITDILLKVSAARCARVSYKVFGGSNANSVIENDIELFNRLLVSQPLHASPAEHQATPDEYEWNTGYQHTSEHGNFRGWRQFRKQLPNEFVPG